MVYPMKQTVNKEIADGCTVVHPYNKQKNCLATASSGTFCIALIFGQKAAP